jgi:hypothetical protein
MREISITSKEYREPWRGSCGCLVMLAIITLPLLAIASPRAQVAAAIAYAALADCELPRTKKPDVKPPEPTPAEPQRLPEVEPTKPPEVSVLKAPRVQCLIVGEAWCPACNKLHDAIEKQLVTDIKKRGEQPWKVGSTRDAQFRFVTVDEFEDEFGRFTVRGIPKVFFVVDGLRTETRERNPANLATEYILQLNSKAKTVVR